MPVYINLVSEDSLVVVRDVTINYTAREIIQLICEKKGISTTRDLALIYINGNYEHYLDEDEYIADYAEYLEDKHIQEEPEARKTSRMSFLHGWSKSFDDLGQSAF